MSNDGKDDLTGSDLLAKFKCKQEAKSFFVSGAFATGSSQDCVLELLLSDNQTAMFLFRPELDTR